jgi:hypothetical protein
MQTIEEFDANKNGCTNQNGIGAPMHGYYEEH